MANLHFVPVPNHYWKAISENDKTFDETFFYGVKTTGIFCRPSCKSRLPNQENVVIFKNAFSALKEGFRPCKRCKPDDLKLPAAEWVEQISGWIDHHFTEPCSLERLAEIFHGSPFHLQRLFKYYKKVSPSVYVQQLRLKKAEELLNDSTITIEEAGFAAGFTNTSYFITLFKKVKGLTPGQYRDTQEQPKGVQTDGNTH